MKQKFKESVKFSILCIVAGVYVGLGVSMLNFFVVFPPPPSCVSVYELVDASHAAFRRGEISGLQYANSELATSIKE